MKTFPVLLDSHSLPLLDTVQKLNVLAATNVEKLAALQVANLQAYSELGVGQLKTLAEVKTADDLHAYLVHQVDALNAINQRLLADTEALVKLNTKFSSELQKIAQESVAAAQAQAA